MTKPSIVSVLESYGFYGLVDYGGWHAVRCEFHGDRHASASYNPEENVFKCHACDISGDAWAVVMQHEGISFLEAKQRVSGITGSHDSQLREGSLVTRSRLPLWARARLSRQQGDQSGPARLLSARRGRRIA